jgi:hypothetical protein
MGVDIHMYICKDKKYIAENIFGGGRNSEWFNNLQQNGNDESYNELNIHCGYSDEAPNEYKEKYNKDNSDYGFRFFTVGDFMEWFIKYRPDKDAGWTTRYEAWRYKEKGIHPDYLAKELFSEDIIEDREFIEVINKYDCSNWLYNYLVDHNIPNDADIVYCFDC